MTTSDPALVGALDTLHPDDMPLRTTASAFAKATADKRGDARPTNGGHALCGVERSEQARRRLLSRRAEPLFIADWDRVMFLHFEVPAGELQWAVPFELDLYEGRAFVSLVAFTLRGMRFRFGEMLGKWLCRPIATHDFLNVRAYVRHEGEQGIYFLREWLSNSISVRLGPALFGLPYQLGKLDYRHTHEIGRYRGRVRDMQTQSELHYEAVGGNDGFVACPAGSLDEFLLERYTAFTCRRGRRGFFRVWHEPWPQAPVRATVLRDDLLRENWPWFREARFAGAHCSPAARNVWMGWPHRQ